MSAKKAAVKSRDSLSSVATSNDYNEDSGYSTPATSAAITPAEQPKSSSTTRRGRRALGTSATESFTPSVNAVARAAALRNSQFSLGGPALKKRKATVLDSDDENDSDNTPDAQLARALQEQEDAAANGMSGMETEDFTPRRTARKLSKILPKVSISDSDDDSDDDFKMPDFSPRLAKRPKVELASNGSNAIKFSSTTKSKVIKDSDDADDFIEIDDSDEDDDSDAPIPMTRSLSRANLSTSKTGPKSGVSKQKSITAALPASGPMSGGRGISHRSRQRKQSSLQAAQAAAGFADMTAAQKLAFIDAQAAAAASSKPGLSRENTRASNSTSDPTSPADLEESDLSSSEFDMDESDSDLSDLSSDENAIAAITTPAPARARGGRSARQRINLAEERHNRRGRQERARLELHHPELNTMWQDLDNLPKIGSVTIEQPKNITRELKPFQLEGVAWMKAMEQTEWGGGLLGDEMGMGKTIQAVSLIMSDWPAKQPSLVLIPPVALMQWQQEIKDYTDGTLRTFVFHGTNTQTKGISVKELKKYDVILMSYNSLESMFRKQEKGFKRKNGLHKEKSVIHQIKFHRVILDEAHNINMLR